MMVQGELDKATCCATHQVTKCDRWQQRQGEHKYCCKKDTSALMRFARRLFLVVSSWCFEEREREKIQTRNGNCEAPANCIVKVNKLRASYFTHIVIHGGCGIFLSQRSAPLCRQPYFSSAW